MPPLPERDPNDWRPRTRPWLRDRMVRRVSPHLDEVEESRVQIPPMLLVLILLVLAVIGFLLFRVNLPPGPIANTPAAFGGKPTPVPILTIPAVGVSPTPVVVKYKVQSGDTLTGIASKFSISVPALMTANNLKSDLIHAGLELIIPPASPAH